VGSYARSGTKTAEPFLYNGRRYRLHVQKSTDAKMERQFLSRKTTSAADRIIRINGTIQNVATGKRTSFRLWYEKERDLPLRFEYKPRSFLNLAFERLPG
jgi:hypothetical protein